MAYVLYYLDCVVNIFFSFSFPSKFLWHKFFISWISQEHFFFQLSFFFKILPAQVPR
jgi:hypothetical protein